MPGKVTRATIRRRYDRISTLAEELVNQRAEDRVGTQVEVLIESVTPSEHGGAEGRAAHQGPEDGSTRVTGEFAVGDLVRARVVGTDGVDLLAEPLAVVSAATPAGLAAGRP
jgi:tRNA A37 methylthiotransferase MiaB